MRSAFAHQLALGYDRFHFPTPAHFGIVDVAAGAGQVAEDLADDVLVARFLEIGLDDFLGVGIGFLGREPHLVRRPASEQPVAPRGDAERGLLVHRVLAFLALLAVAEIGHGSAFRVESRPGVSAKRRQAASPVPRATQGCVARWRSS